MEKRENKKWKWVRYLKPKITLLLDLPLLGELHYPPSLLELQRKLQDIIAAHTSTEEGTSQEAPQSPPSHSPPEGPSHRNHANPEFPPGGFQIGDGSQPDGSPSDDFQPVNMEFHSISSDANMESSDHFNAPRSPAGQSSGSSHCSGSGHFEPEMPPPNEPEMPPPNSTRYMERHHSSAGGDLGNVGPVEKDTMTQEVRDSKMQWLSENGPPQDSDLLEETWPTQTPPLAIAEPTVDEITESEEPAATQIPHPMLTEPTVDEITKPIILELKSQFDGQGSPHIEFSKIASGKNRREAAMLLYGLCVLATEGLVMVEREEIYEDRCPDIMILKGPKME